MAAITIDGLEYPLALAIPPDLKDRIDTVEVEFVHDGKGKASLSKTVAGFSGAKVTERVQPAAPPHAIVIVREKPAKRDPATRVRVTERALDVYGSALTYTVNNAANLPLNERNSIPLVGRLPAGDAPKAISEGVVATG